MTTGNCDLEEREQRWGAVLVECLEVLESGRPVDRGALAAAHPEFAEELVEFLTQRDRIYRLAAPVRAVALAGAASTDPDLLADTVGGSPGLSPDAAVRSFGDYEI